MPWRRSRPRALRRDSGPHLALLSRSNLPGRARFAPFRKPRCGGSTSGSFWSANSTCSMATGSTGRAGGAAGDVCQPPLPGRLAAGGRPGAGGRSRPCKPGPNIGHRRLRGGRLRRTAAERLSHWLVGFDATERPNAWPAHQLPWWRQGLRSIVATEQRHVAPLSARSHGITGLTQWRPLVVPEGSLGCLLPPWLQAQRCMLGLSRPQESSLTRPA